jgi:hypothetical protein
MPGWEDPDWLEAVHAWIRDQAERLGLCLTGAIEQVHVRPWSTVLRVPTTEGDAWFKANSPTEVHEAAVVSVLAAERPDCVPPLLAVDLERGWMLMSDAGERLRDIVERERDLTRWFDVLPLYAGLQLDVADRADELVARGAPDRRLATLADQYERLLDLFAGSEAKELERLRSLMPRVRDLCDELSGYGIPETIQHDDFHDGQVFLRDGRYLLLDWGDCCVSHPLCSMSVTLEGQLAWGLDDVEGAIDTTPFRDAYLVGFEHYGTREELEAAQAIALRLGWICRAVNSVPWESPPTPRAVERFDLLMQMFLGGLD